MLCWKRRAFCGDPITCSGIVETLKGHPNPPAPNFTDSPARLRNGRELPLASNTITLQQQDYRSSLALRNQSVLGNLLKRMQFGHFLPNTRDLTLALSPRQRSPEFQPAPTSHHRTRWDGLRRGRRGRGGRVPLLRLDTHVVRDSSSWRA